MSVWKEQRLQDHFVVLCNELDVDRIVPILRNEHMLTTDEMETLTNPYFTTRVRREKLLIILPRKGRAHFQKFAECLVWSGQEELAKKIGVPVEKITPSPYPSAPAGSSVSATQQAEFFRLLRAMMPDHLGTSALPAGPAPPSYTTSPQYPQLAPAPTTTSYPQHTAPHHPYTQPTAHPTRQQQHPPLVLMPEHRQSAPKEVFILYCNDPNLKAIEGQDFSDDVLLLADVLFKCCGSYVKINFDGYDDIPDPGNWSRWTEECITRSDLVILVCSPTLIQRLHTNSHDTVPMKRGVFFPHAVFNMITPHKFIPVFLNVGLDESCVANTHSEPYCNWVPTSLRASTRLWLNVRALDNAMGNTEGMQAAEFWQKLSDLLQERRFEHMAHLLSRLMGTSFTPQPTPTPRPQPQHTAPTAATAISDGELMTIAERIPRDWQHLGIKLGVPYSVLEDIRRNHAFDTRQAAMEMFAAWRRMKRDNCTRVALKEALQSLGYGRVAQEVFGRK